MMIVQQVVYNRDMINDEIIQRILNDKRSDYFTKRIDLSFVKEKNKLKVKI